MQRSARASSYAPNRKVFVRRLHVARTVHEPHGGSVASTGSAPVIGAQGAW
jgi:hypothetical protein